MKLFLNVAFAIKYATHLLLPTTANIFIDFFDAISSRSLKGKLDLDAYELTIILIQFTVICRSYQYFNNQQLSTSLL